MWVVFYHLRFVFEQSRPGDWFINFIYAGYLGVDMFSFLSGFIISYIYGERLQTFSPRPVTRYLWLRFVRTYPLHLFILGLFLLVFVKTRGAESLMVVPYDASFIRQLFLLNGLGFEDRWSWNVPSWTLSSEWFCYLCFPLAAPLIMRIGAGWKIILLAIGSLMATWLILSAIGHPQFDTFLEWGLIRIGGEFLTGCWLYRMYKAGIGQRMPAGWIGLIAIMVIIIKSAAYPQLPAIISVTAFAVLIFTLATNQSPLKQIFGNRVAVYFGDISYSIYMIHWFFVVNMEFFGFNSIAIQYRPWAVLGTVIIASIFTFEFIEQPSRKFLRNRVLAKPADTSRTRTTAPEAAQRAKPDTD